MNQILDHSGPKKPKARKNPEDTMKIIKVYAFLIIVFGICFIGKGGYSLVENKRIEKQQEASQKISGPLIELFADLDELSINVSYNQPLESISYQWYRGIVTREEILEYEELQQENDDTEDSEVDDDEIQEETDDIVALGDLEELKLENENQKKIQKIGIPRGDSTIRVIVKVNGGTISEFIQSYHTDVGVDKIAPKINVKLQGKKLIVTATDETEISKLIYSVNGSSEKEVDDRLDKKTIKAEIELSEVETNSVSINAVDKAKNTGTYTQEIELFVGKPEIQFSAEPDFSKIYIIASYSKGITKIEYDLNGESFVKEYDDPEEEVEISLESVVGHNVVSVKVYTKEEQVYAEDIGECDYNP